MEPFNCRLVYYGRHEKPYMKELDVEFYDDLDEMLGLCDIITINIPLTDKTK